MIDYTPKHLVMVEAGQNRNKYYDLTPNGDTWVAKYGRVGSSSQTRTYHITKKSAKVMLTKPTLCKI